jgi:outer membrane biosynthesis protein TonB
MTTSARIAAFLAAAAVCLPLAACGDDDVGDPIPQAKADRLVTELDAARDQADQDLCDEAATAVDQARATVDTLDDDGVGSDVQDALGDGVDNLSSLVSDACEPEEVETTPETVPETVPPPTETIPPTTTETVPPAPTEPEPTTPVPAPEPAPDEDDGGAQFDPNADIPPGKEKKLKDDD